ncbi:MAG TPA: GT4 family glycosyltransferase PelF [Polyangia bacterium]|nr:GT4 family glycosyltransferase PelF [Polyangia bacterium]
MTRLPRLGRGESADIGLLLEGTYPYVSGGVSAWVHEIITGFPDLTFGICFLGATPDMYGDIKYRLPDNVVHVEVHHLMAGVGPTRPRRGRAREVAQPLAALAALHEAMRSGATPGPAVVDGLAALDGDAGLSLHEFLHDDRSFLQLCAEYDAHHEEESFLDFFWTLRTMHLPLFKLAAIGRDLPRFGALHAVSTGYAGALGALVRRRTGVPFVLTEHGIYTKERTIDLAHASWIKDAPAVAGRRALGGLRRLWIQFFEALGRMAYAAADPIVSLYEGNRARQIADGAAAGRTRVVPNGIDLDRFAAVRRDDRQGPPPVVGLIGRVVPIKDIKTFIRAMREVVGAIPEAQAWIVGPEDEDRRYADECRALARTLGLDGGALRFLGFRRAEEVLPELGVAVLTSISEALPLFVLEAFAAGVPVVASDVGCCRELIEGRGALAGDSPGTAGAITGIASPAETARAVVQLLQDPDAWRRARRAAAARVHALYGRARMLAAYREIYDGALEETHGGNRLRAS